jgi:hypothetical protein
MEYRLKVKKKTSAAFSNASIFPDTLISFDLDFYDVDNIDKIKLPVSLSLSLPMDNINKTIIDYNPASSDSDEIPTSPFDFELLLNGNKILKGNLYVEGLSYNNNIPTIKVRLLDRLQEVLSDSKLLTYSDMYSNDYSSPVAFNTFLSSKEGAIGTEPNMADIELPYVDFCNDIEKFGYAARQFLQFGYSREKSGFVPALSLRNFIDRFFTAANTSVTSRFFKLGNYGTSLATIGHDIDPLYMLMPTKLESTNPSVRGFLVREGPFEYFRNIYTEDASSTLAREKPNFPQQGYGWHYGAQPAANTVDTGFGLSYSTNVPNDLANQTRAFFGSHMSYNSRPLNTSRTLPSGAWVGFEVPMIKVTQSSFSMVDSINIPSSTMVVNFKAVLWEDEVIAQTYRMCNADGSIKNISVTNATLGEQVLGYLPFEVGNNGGYGNISNTAQNPTQLDNLLKFDDAAIGSFIWEQKDHEINAGSQYAMSIEVEFVSGHLNLQYVDIWGPVYATGTYEVGSTALKLAKSDDIAKAVYREDTNNIANLYLALGAHGTFNPYFDTDEVSILDTLSNIKSTPFEVVKEIIKRFNLSVVYDQNSDSILIDRLVDIRDSSVLNISNKVDDREPIEIDIVSKTAKSISFKGTVDLFYDTFGYDTKELNPAGSDDLTFSMKSRFYNNSLSGDYIDGFIPDGFSEFEVGFTTNDFTSAKSIGIVFGYLEEPNYTTNIRRGKFVQRTGYKGILYDITQGYVFNRFVRDKSGALPLYYFNEQGVTTDLYNFFTANDNINFYGKPTIKFKALFDSDYAFDIKNNYSIVDIPYLNSDGLLIKSISGEVYETGVYGEVEAIIL